MDWQRADELIRRGLWSADLQALPRWKAAAVRLVRLVSVVLRDVLFGQLTLRAMSLVYTTLLSLVPLLAFSFSVLKAFGVHNQLEPVLRQFLLPLGEQGRRVTDQILAFIDNLNVGVLGAVGLAFLLYTAVSVVRKTEESVNYIWHVRQPRSFSERFSSYVTMLLVGPILVFTALGLTATVIANEQVQQVLALEPVGQLLAFGSRLLPYLLVVLAFTFAYVFLPNVRVRIVPALVGGVTGGVLWQSAGWAFAGFVAESDRYEAIYAGFAVLVFFLIWLYVSWLILLIGASVAFYLQNPQYVVPEAGEPRLSNRMRERLALLVMTRVAQRYVRGELPLTREDLAQGLDLQTHALDFVLDALCAGGLLVESADPACAYVPARDLAGVSVAHMLDLVRTAGEQPFLSPRNLPIPVTVEDLIERRDSAAHAALSGLSLRDLGLLQDKDAGAQGAWIAPR
jgi:membrane protein